MRRFAITFTLASVLAIAIVRAAASTAIDGAIVDTRMAQYAQGMADGKAQTEQRLNKKATPQVQKYVDGFCSGALVLAWFDAGMSVTQEQVDTYAVTSHECTATRYLGSLSVTNYAGEPGTDYVFVLTMHGKETWWVFTINAAGKIADVQ